MYDSTRPRRKVGFTPTLSESNTLFAYIHIVFQSLTAPTKNGLYIYFAALEASSPEAVVESNGVCACAV